MFAKPRRQRAASSPSGSALLPTHSVVNKGATLATLVARKPAPESCSTSMDTQHGVDMRGLVRKYDSSRLVLRRRGDAPQSSVLSRTKRTGYSNFAAPQIRSVLDGEKMCLALRACSEKQVYLSPPALDPMNELTHSISALPCAALLRKQLLRFSLAHFIFDDGSPLHLQLSDCSAPSCNHYTTDHSGRALTSHP